MHFLESPDPGTREGQALLSSDALQLDTEGILQKHRVTIRSARVTPACQTGANYRSQTIANLPPVSTLGCSVF